jgi:gas vesicle protein
MHIGKYESSENSNVGTAITFLLIGLGVGALTGLLLAPKTGKAFRKDIKRGYDDARDTIEDWADDAKSHMGDVRDTAREVGERLRDAASRGADIASDLRERVEPLRRAINRS